MATDFITGNYYMNVSPNAPTVLYKATAVYSDLVVLDALGDNTSKPRALFYDWPDITVVPATAEAIQPALDVAAMNLAEARIVVETREAVVNELTAAIEALNVS